MTKLDEVIQLRQDLNNIKGAVTTLYRCAQIHGTLRSANTIQVELTILESYLIQKAGEYAYEQNANS